MTLPWTSENHCSLQHVHLLPLHVLSHLLDGLDVLLEGGASPHDVGLSRHIESLQSMSYIENMSMSYIFKSKWHFFIIFCKIFLLPCLWIWAGKEDGGEMTGSSRMLCSSATILARSSDTSEQVWIMRCDKFYSTQIWDSLELVDLTYQHFLLRYWYFLLVWIQQPLLTWFLCGS